MTEYLPPAGYVPSYSFGIDASVCRSPGCGSFTQYVGHVIPKTGTGTNIETTASGDGDATLTFDNVTAPGVTTIQTILRESAPPALEDLYTLDSALFYDIDTTATFSGAITVCLGYDPGLFPDPAAIRLLHHDGVAWVDVTFSNDPVNGVICGIVTSLSPFAIVPPAAPPMTISGFYSPVDTSSGEDIVWNTVKGGSNVPLKFEVFQDGAEITDVAAVTVSIEIVSCIAQPADAIESTAATSSGLTYNGSHFQQNWKTPKLAGGCYRVTVTTTDGASIAAWFKLK